MNFLKNVHRFIPGFRQLSPNSMVIAATYYGASAFVAVKLWHWGLALLALPFFVFSLLDLNGPGRKWPSRIAALAAGAIVLLGSAAGVASGGAPASDAGPAPLVISAAPRPSAATAVAAASARPIAPPEQAQYAFVAAKGGGVYHRPDCYSAGRIKPGNLIGFGTREEAEAAGLRPCKQCKP